jgi:hypothetical protein
LGIQCEENWCLYEILKFALWVCLQKCSALSLNLKICSIFSAFNSAHNAFAEQMQQCYTALGIAHQSSEIGKKIADFLSFLALTACHRFWKVCFFYLYK